MADHPLRAILAWPVILIVGLFLCLILGTVVVAVIAVLIDRHRQAIVNAEYEDGR